MECSCCHILSVEERTAPLCRICFLEVPTEIDHTLSADSVRFQKYLIEGMRLSSQALTQRRMEEGLCPYVSRTRLSAERSRRLLQEYKQQGEVFRQLCPVKSSD